MPAAPPRIGTILVVDDEAIVRELTHETLRREGHDVRSVTNGREAVAALQNDGAEVVVSDLMMPELDGLQLLEWTRQHRPDTEFVMVTAHGDANSGIRAVQLGAYDYITKPFPLDHLVLIVGRALERRRLISKSRALQQQLRGLRGIDTIVGSSPAIDLLRQRIRMAADSDVTVLVSGETGTGKELVASALHQTSNRCEGPFVSVNCAALPESLIASELFGHEKGSFTSAVSNRIGRFEAAHRGTLHLDEIGDLPLPAQGILLRVLEEKRFERVGSSRPIDVDVRIVAATKRDLSGAVQNGSFREDLFFRLNVMTVHCPPLRERSGDIPLLVDHFLSKLDPATRPNGVTRPALKQLMVHSWPGNVRELENAIKRAHLLSRGRDIDEPDLELALDCSGNANACSLKLDDIERQHLQRVLELHAWNRSEAARSLGIDRSTLQRKIAAYGLEEQHVKESASSRAKT